jgi:hypothetical protein
MTSKRCPSHPTQPLDDCAYCEQRIAQIEQAEGGHALTDDHADADRYERWLDRIGER